MPYLQKNSVVRGSSDYTCEEYARRFNLAPSTVRSKVSRGDIPSYRVGGARRIPAEYVVSILNARTTTAPAARKARRNHRISRNVA